MVELEGNQVKIVEPSYTILSPVRRGCSNLTPGYEFDPSGILRLIELAGRTCYKSEDRITDDSADKFVRMVRERGHESVFEHSSLTVKFVVDRGVSHELVRHRLCAFSQESTRYCNYGKSGEVTFVRPPFWGQAHPCYAKWFEAMHTAETLYLAFLAMGATPQEARSVLPNSLKTEVVTTANLREWRHILRLRTSKAAHPQMRQVMVPLLEELYAALPVLFEDLVQEAAG